MQNLKYLERVVNEDDRFGVILNEYAVKHTDHIQIKIALSLLEFFNSGKFVDERDIEKTDNIFYVSKEKYIKPKTIKKSRVFSVRINIDDENDEVSQKLAKLSKQVEKFRNFK